MKDISSHARGRGVTDARFGLVLCALYAGLRALHWGSLPGVVAFPDTAVYERMASLSLADPEFWAGSRPWTVPLLYKLLGSDGRLVGALQLVLSVAAWSALAVAVAGRVRSRALRRPALALVLAFSASANVVLWDRALLSESVSISLMAVLIAAWLRVSDGWRPASVAQLLAVALLWGFARESNAWVLLILGGALGLAAAVHRSRRRLLVVAAFFAVLALANNVSANRSGRWVKPFLNVVTQRILPDPDSVSRLAALGMPVSPRLLSLAGQWATSEDRALYEDPALEEFRSWLHASGKLGYVRFLLSDPSHAWRPFADADQLLFREPAKRVPGFEPLLPGPLAAVSFPGRRGMIALAVLAAVLAAMAVRDGSRGELAWRPAWTVALATLALALPHAALTWHGDANEVARHAVQASLQLRLGLWLVVLAAADAAIRRPGAPSPDAPSPG